MLNKEELKKLEDYLKGQSGREETAWVNRLFSEGESDEILNRHLFDEWVKTQADKGLEGENFEYILDRLHHIIHLKESSRQHKPLTRMFRIYMKIASILLVPVLIATGIMISFPGRDANTAIASGYDATIYAPLGSRVSFKLPDGTSGMLNSGSYLSYSFSHGGIREASLSGEAWFEVKSDPENPFLISAGKSTVKVTGTRFNLSAYPAENYVEVVLDEGRIEFRNDNSDDFILLKPSERLISHDGDIKKSSVDPDKYHAWTDGKLVFKNDPMAEVARRIERWYNVKISIADEELERYSFRATFQDDSVEEVLKYLALTSPIGYRIAPRIIGQDGSYGKQEITIYKTE